MSTALAGGRVYPFYFTIYFQFARALVSSRHETIGRSAAVLDRSRRPVPVAGVHVLGRGLTVRHTGVHHFGVLRHHHTDDLEQGLDARPDRSGPERRWQT